MNAHTLVVLFGIAYLVLAILDRVIFDGSQSLHLIISANVFLAAGFVMQHQNQIQRINTRIRYGD